jgi:LysM repeat protein
MDAGMMRAAIGKPYTVRSGDTLEHISKQAYGRKSLWKLIETHNPGINPNNLRVGAVLNIPEAPGVAEVSPASSRTSPKASSSEPWKRPGDTKLVTTPARSGG